MTKVGYTQIKLEKPIMVIGSDHGQTAISYSLLPSCQPYSPSPTYLIFKKRSSTEPGKDDKTLTLWFL